MSKVHKSQRLYSLDVLRGLTVAAMILVNNGVGKVQYSFLQHSEWNGFTLCDMVFPTFLFIVGIAAYISLRKYNFKWSRSLAIKIVRRTVLILLIGWAIHWIEHMVRADFLPLANLRLTGVLPRIALCYFFTSVFALTFGRKSIKIIIIILLAVYAIILMLGNGFANAENNILVIFDRAVVGADHLYTKQPVDPEGLLSTLSAIAHTLIGFCFGALVKGHHNDPLSPETRMLAIMTYGFIILLAGLALEQIMPINKRVWSPSYVLVSCGLAALALGAIAYIADIRGLRSPFKAFDVFGLNPLFLYVLSEVLAIVLSATGLKHLLFNVISEVMPAPQIASVTYALLLLCAMWAVGFAMYKKKIFIKL